MPTVACAGCNKLYAVPDASLGRRVRCKACDRVFVAAATTARERHPPQRPPPGRPAAFPAAADPDPDGDVWGALLAAAAAETSAVPALPAGPGRRPWPGSLRAAGRAVTAGAGRVRPETLVLVAAFTLVVPVGVTAFLWPAAGRAVEIGYVVTAVVYLVVGLVTQAVRSAGQEGEFQLPWGDLLLMLVLGVLPVALIYWLIGRELTAGRFWRRAAGLLLGSLLIFGGAVGLWIVAQEAADVEWSHRSRAMAVRVAALRPPSPFGPNGVPNPAVGLRPGLVPLVLPDPSRIARRGRRSPIDEPGADLPTEAADSPPRRTADNLDALFTAEVRYQNAHDLTPAASIADLARWAPPITSPFDPTSAEPGYVFVAGNVSDPHVRVIFYDAAELRLTGRTHVIYHPGRRVAVLTREALAAEPGVTVP